jgi:NitT/TauT family transport system ATP-binding protein
LAIQRRRTPAERSMRVAELVDFVGLAGFERHYPAQLSGGMNQRVNLARALATDPQLLLMDEPFGALDAQTREQLQVELSRICEQRASTILFITHDIEEAVFLSDRVIAMTGRPGSVRGVLEIDLPRPRPAPVKRTEHFAALEQRIWDLLSDDVPAGP